MRFGKKLTHLLHNPRNQLIQRETNERLGPVHMPHVLLERELINLVIEQLFTQIEEMFVEVSWRVGSFHEKRGRTPDVVET